MSWPWTFKTGTVVWDKPVADYHVGWQTLGWPIVAKGKVMVGIVGQGPGGGAVVALDAQSGQEAWRFHTIARPGEFGGRQLEWPCRWRSAMAPRCGLLAAMTRS